MTPPPKTNFHELLVTPLEIVNIFLTPSEIFQLKIPLGNCDFQDPWEITILGPLWKRGIFYPLGKFHLCGGGGGAGVDIKWNVPKPTRHRTLFQCCNSVGKNIATSPPNISVALMSYKRGVPRKSCMPLTVLSFILLFVIFSEWQNCGITQNMDVHSNVGECITTSITVVCRIKGMSFTLSVAMYPTLSFCSL